MLAEAVLLREMCIRDRACVVMQLVSGGSIRVLDMLFSTLEVFDRSHGGWFSPLVFVLFPMVAAGMNLLSLLNVLYDAERRAVSYTHLDVYKRQ